MSNRRRNRATEAGEPREPEGLDRPTWARRTRRLASLLIAAHLLAVVTGPWSGPPPASVLAQDLARSLAPYLYAMHLNHGYRFFAPNPGPSHLVRYELQMPDGRIVPGHFPDRQRHWPRLLYHRYFMVSETVFTLSAPLAAAAGEGPGGATPNQPPPSMPEAELRWHRDRFQKLIRSIARHLLLENGAQRVRLYLQTHLIPFPPDVAAGMRLDDPSLYEERRLIELSKDEL